MDIQLHYHENGQGFPLILLHGNGESSAYFQNQLPAFGEYFRVIALDTRGHGGSPRGTAPFSLEQFAEDLHSFMEEMGIRRAHILGFSDGANIALLFALRYPQMVEKLILNGGNLDPHGVKPMVQIPIVAGYGVASLLACLHKKTVALKERLGLMVKQPHIAPEALSALVMPVLVVAGTKDMIKTAHTRQIAAAIPHAALRLLKGDHFIAAKSSAAFNAVVLDFLLQE